MNVELSCKQPTSAMSEAWMHVQVDNRQQQDLLVTATQAVDLCDRHFGIGADGVRLELQPVEGILMAYGMGQSDLELLDAPSVNLDNFPGSTACQPS